MARLFLILFCLSQLACGGLFFYPSKTLVREPLDVGVPFENVSIQLENGLALHGWFLPVEGIKEKGTVLFLHGNAENISTHLGSVYWLPQEGYSVFLFDYRGYGKSSGKPGIAEAIEDGEYALRYLAGRTSKEVPIFVFGQSLGGALAVPLVAKAKDEIKIAGLVLDSAFSSYRRIVRDKLQHFYLTWPLAYPVSWLFPGEFNPEAWIGRVQPIPVLLLHAAEDQIVPAYHSERLFAAAREPKSMHIEPSGAHTSSLQQSASRKMFLDFLSGYPLSSSSYKK